jgi:pimeloyl-ACP methyl ester carboxylesterase
LLIWGNSDPAYSLQHSNELAADLDRPEVHRVANAGHFPMLDAADTFNRLLIDFLALDRGASPNGIQPKEEWRGSALV